jgi:cytochrome c-type biogenesis protein CcmH/NrfG
VPALHVRSGNAPITGDNPGGAPTPLIVTQRVLEAQKAIVLHPRSDIAYVQLGNAYLQAGQADAADAGYRRAMQLAPHDPQPITLHALLIGTAGQWTRALRLIHGVERDHPAYARAWLVDGLLAPSRRHDHRASIHAWRHFLQIDPTGKMATQVRQWVFTAQKADRNKP